MLKCSDCGQEFESTQALGSHKYYQHIRKNIEPNFSICDDPRVMEVARKIADERGVPLPRDLSWICPVSALFPRGISPKLDPYIAIFDEASQRVKALGEIESDVESETES